MLWRELAVLASLLYKPPLRPFVVPCHCKGRLVCIEEVYSFVARVVEVEGYLSRLQVCSSIHQEVPIVREQTVLQFVL